MPPSSDATRERHLFDHDWRFAFGHPYDTERDFGHGTGYFSHLAKHGYGDGPAALDFDDRAFRLLDLPHDWAVELPFAAEGSHSHGYKALGRKFPETSVGWYRKRFFVAEAELGRRISIEFEGIFRDAQVFVNGFFLGREASGYSGFHYDLSDLLNYGGENVIAVRVDATVEEGWFYEGAGIYRHVWLHKTSPLHVAADGIAVSSELGDGVARVHARAEIANDSSRAATVDVTFALLNPRGEPCGSGYVSDVALVPGTKLEVAAAIDVQNPELWSLANPALCTLVTSVIDSGVEIDRVPTRFGIRSVHFDANHGFFLNGEHVLLKGTNNHQDHAGVGTAIPDALQDFRIRALKAMGSNAYRSSHHPASPALLDACDRLGMLVIDENRLLSASPSALRDLEAMIRRNRNHPSVILWSLGNEEWWVEGNERGARITNTLQIHARRLDPTRRVTVAISGGWGRGISTVVDVMGYNYISHGSTDEQHALFPNQPGVGTEETTTQGTRGIYVTDAARAHSAPILNGSSGGNMEIGWKYYAARPYLAGLFYWTGFDYRGESNPFLFPAVSSQYGILDTCGFPKDGFHYLRAWWGDEPVLHVFPHWNWPGREGQILDVWAYSNVEEIELFLNEQSLGRKFVEKNGHLEWPVAYHPGVLSAVGYVAGAEVITTEIMTTGPATTLTLGADRTTLLADDSDVAVIAVEALDADGQNMPVANDEVTFTLSGPGRILGVGNGDPSSHEADRVVAVPRITPVEGFREATGNDGERVFSAVFHHDGWPAGSIGRLLLRHFGDEQTVHLNGRLVGKSARSDAALPEIQLDASWLVAGENLLSITARAYASEAAREQAEKVPPARIRLDVPVEPWKRRLFNGLAQVIVQTTDEAGTITLRATAPGLTGAELSLQVAARAGATPAS